MAEWFKALDQERREKLHDTAVVVCNSVAAGMGGVKPEQFQKFLEQLLNPPVTKAADPVGEAKQAGLNVEDV